MPVFRRDNFSILYVHIPKTGGSTIESLFKQSGFSIEYLDTGGKNSLNNLTHCSPQHFHREILESIFNIEKFDYIFTTIRNPISRIKSEYLMMNRGNKTDVNKWITDTLSTFNNNPFIYDNHIRPQSDFILGSGDIFKLEDGFNLEWIENLEEKIPFNLHKNISHDLNRKKLDGITTSDVMLNTKTTELIMNFYKDDFNNFKY